MASSSHVLDLDPVESPGQVHSPCLSDPPTFPRAKANSLFGIMRRPSLSIPSQAGFLNSPGPPPSPSSKHSTSPTLAGPEPSHFRLSPEALRRLSVALTTPPLHVLTSRAPFHDLETMDTGRPDLVRPRSSLTPRLPCPLVSAPSDDDVDADDQATETESDPPESKASAGCTDPVVMLGVRPATPHARPRLVSATASLPSAAAHAFATHDATPVLCDSHPSPCALAVPSSTPATAALPAAPPSPRALRERALTEPSAPRDSIGSHSHCSTDASYSDQRSSYSDQRSSYSDQRSSYNDQRSSLSLHRPDLPLPLPPPHATHSASSLPSLSPCLNPHAQPLLTAPHAQPSPAAAPHEHPDTSAPTTPPAPPRRPPRPTASSHTLSSSASLSSSEPSLPSIYLFPARSSFSSLSDNAHTSATHKPTAATHSPVLLPFPHAHHAHLPTDAHRAASAQPSQGLDAGAGLLPPLPAADRYASTPLQPARTFDTPASPSGRALAPLTTSASDLGVPPPPSPHILAISPQQSSPHSWLGTHRRVATTKKRVQCVRFALLPAQAVMGAHTPIQRGFDPLAPYVPTRESHRMPGRSRVVFGNLQRGRVHVEAEVSPEELDDHDDEVFWDDPGHSMLATGATQQPCKCGKLQSAGGSNYASEDGLCVCVLPRAQTVRGEWFVPPGVVVVADPETFRLTQERTRRVLARKVVLAPNQYVCVPERREPLLRKVSTSQAVLPLPYSAAGLVSLTSLGEAHEGAGKGKKAAETSRRHSMCAFDALGPPAPTQIPQLSLVASNSAPSGGPDACEGSTKQGGPVATAAGKRAVLVNPLSGAQITHSLLELSYLTAHEQRCLAHMRRGCYVYKYKAFQPTRRFLFLSEDDLSICWRQLTSKEEKAFQRYESLLEHDKTSEGPCAQQVGWALFGKSVKHVLTAELTGLCYGPYLGKGFSPFTQACDRGEAKAWHALSVETHGETLNLVFSSVRDVSVWIMGLQLLAPACGRSITMGRMLWLRTIMKINYIGFHPFVRSPAQNWSPSVNRPGILGPALPDKK